MGLQENGNKAPSEKKRNSRKEAPYEEKWTIYCGMLDFLTCHGHLYGHSGDSKRPRRHCSDRQNFLPAFGSSQSNYRTGDCVHSSRCCCRMVEQREKREVKVQFLKGKECALGSSAPTGFRLESQKCYTTSHVPAGGISSLKFDEEGTYEFEVEFQGVGKKKGKVVVTKME